MSFTTRLYRMMYHLPSAQAYKIKVRRNIPVTMPDGVILLTDHYTSGDAKDLPTILIRTPYGRNGFGFLGAFYAEQGFQAIVQACRGTDGSSGEFKPFRQERDDGLVTIAWLKKQTWYSGTFAFMGQSYLGYAALAASEADPDLKAMAIQITAPDMQRMMYPGGVFSFATWFWWMVASVNKVGNTLRVYSNYKRYVNRLPLENHDKLATGEHQPHWHEWLAHTQPGDAYWNEQDHWHRISAIKAPVQLMGGWYDFFLPDTLRLYRELHDAGRQPQLIIGPWTHRTPAVVPESMRESLAWFNEHLLGQASTENLPVRIFLQGANEWRRLEEWPVKGITQAWYLQPEDRLESSLPIVAEKVEYMYDPTHPTPSVGGVSNGFSNGPRDQREREERSDVVAFTSKPLSDNLDAIGNVYAELFVSSSLEHADFFVRLCDVDQKGASVNVCDGIVRVTPETKRVDNMLHLDIELFPTAYQFKSGHRLRLQVSSGSFPHYARNHGTGEALATAVAMKSARQTVYFSPERPSCVKLTIA